MNPNAPVAELASGLARVAEGLNTPSKELVDVWHKLMGGNVVILPPTLEKAAIYYAVIVGELGLKDGKSMEWMVASMRSFLIGALVVHYRYHPQDMLPKR